MGSGSHSAGFAAGEVTADRAGALELRLDAVEQLLVMDVRLKRAYEPASPADGDRVLIDRLWPRGVSREQARLDGWEKELAPSATLRQWFGHDPGRFEEFRRRYIDELRLDRSRTQWLTRRLRPR